MKAVVTIKLPRDPKHDPRNKRQGKCPISKIIGREIWCTDVTGSHHSYVETGYNAKEIRGKIEARFKHITRIEFFDEE